MRRLRQQSGGRCLAVLAVGVRAWRGAVLLHSAASPRTHGKVRMLLLLLALAHHTPRVQVQVRLQKVDRARMNQ